MALALALALVLACKACCWRRVRSFFSTLFILIFLFGGQILASATSLPPSSSGSSALLVSMCNSGTFSGSGVWTCSWRFLLFSFFDDRASSFSGGSTSLLSSSSLFSMFSLSRSLVMIGVEGDSTTAPFDSCSCVSVRCSVLTSDLCFLFFSPFCFLALLGAHNPLLV